MCADPTWWEEALPKGRTMVTWGGKEIFADDVVELVEMLDEVSLDFSLR